MKRWLSAAAAFALLLVLSLPVYAEQAVPKAVLESSSSVVRIIAEYKDSYSTGSGFIIHSGNDATLVTTNRHVIEGDPIDISI